jgi:uncharacterized protein YkwD
VLGWRTAPLVVSLLPLVAAMVAGAPAMTTSPSAGAAASTATSMSDDYEAGVVYWTNVKRKRHGREPLRAWSCPDSYAEQWSSYLARTGRFYHQDVTRMFDCSGVNRVAENLVRGDVTPRQAVNLWMQSDEHRRILLSPRYTRIGVGSYRSMVDGRIYTSQTLTGP